MNVSLNWLSTHLDLGGKSPQELDDLLTFAGIEVEGIEAKGVSSDKVVVAKIMEAVQHPNADRLKVTQVDAGEGTLRQIVCGAKNYQVGDKVPCALPGAALPGGFTIGETKMRGVESKGMLCASTEIGLPEGEDGLLILSADAEIGRPVKELFESDVRLEVEVTPNRPDLLSHRGMARELATLLRQPLKPSNNPVAQTTAAKDEVTLEAADGCPFYTVVKIDGVKIGPSPAWLQQRLESIGLRPINNVVDITNFVLHETGQPLHAFDAAKVKSGLVIRRAKEGETFAALDEETYGLEVSDLVISDASGAALALGGIMGGLESGVTEETTSVLLESAWFEPSGIRRTSRRTALSSDSSYRFERGVDPEGALPGSALAVKLILEMAGGTAGATAVAGEAPVRVKPVTLDYTRLDQLMGGSISHEGADEILTRLGLVKQGGGEWKVPSFRADLQRHIDLVEEVARVHGLEQVPARFQGAFVPSSPVDAAYDADMAIRRTLAGLGFHESQTIKLIAEEQVRDCLPQRLLQEGDLIRVKLPLSEDHVIMRPSLVPGLVASAARNVRQGTKVLRFFELGRVFRNMGGGKAKDLENDSLAVLLSGPAAIAGWTQAERAGDLYDLKGVVSALLPAAKIQFVPKERAGFALAAEVQADGQTVGVFARLLPSRERELDLVGGAYVVEFDLTKVRKLRAGISHAEDLPQFPGSSRDAAMELPATTANAEIEKALAKLQEPLLVSFECFDVFRDPSGEKLAADRKSVAYRFQYRATDRTLKSDEVDATHQRVLESLVSGLGVKFR